MVRVVVMAARLAVLLKSCKSGSRPEASTHCRRRHRHRCLRAVLTALRVIVDDNAGVACIQVPTLNAVRYNWMPPGRMISC